MNINGVNSMSPGTAGMAAGKSGQMDPESKNLQQQIEKLQNDLKEISSNQEMPADTKMKKRQEIQKQISELQIQLRQHQIEVKKEEREKKNDKSSFDDLMGTKNQAKQEGSPNTGMSSEGMTAMISADVSMKQANTHGSVAKKMENRANILEEEIKLDLSRGGSSNIEQKESELADAKKTAEKAASSQLASLAQAGEELKNISKTENTANRTEDSERENDAKNVSEAEKENDSENGTNAVSNGEKQSENGFAYHPVDVRL